MGGERESTEAEQKVGRFFFGVALVRAVGLQQFCGGELVCVLDRRDLNKQHTQGERGVYVWLYASEG